MVVTGENVTLEGNGVVSMGLLETEHEPANAYTAGPLAAGDFLTFTLVPQQSVAQAALTGVAPRNSRWETGLGLVALAGAVLASYWLWRISPSGPMPEGARPLVVSIAALDTRFEVGDVAEEIHRRERASLKRQLCSLMREPETDD
jgi:hypothetical protein